MPSSWADGPAVDLGGIALPHIAASGNADLIDRFVRPTLATSIGSLCVTEPGGGLDVAGIRMPLCTGSLDVVNGAKAFITSARAPISTSAVGTGGPGRRHCCWSSRRTPWFTVDRSLRKMGWHCSDTPTWSYVEVRVPAADLVGLGEQRVYQIAQQFVVEDLGWWCTRRDSRRLPAPTAGPPPRAR